MRMSCRNKEAIIILGNHNESFYASYNIEITRGYGVKNLHCSLNLTVTNFYLAIYLEKRHTSIGYE